MSRGSSAIVGAAAERLDSSDEAGEYIIAGQNAAGRYSFRSYYYSSSQIHEKSKMNALRASGGTARALRACGSRRVLPVVSPIWSSIPRRGFHAFPALWGIRPQTLQDVGEGRSSDRCLAVQQQLLTRVSARDNGGSDHPVVRRGGGTY